MALVTPHDDPPRWLYPLAALLVFVLLFARDPAGLLQPALPYEDGFQLLTFYQENRDLGDIWRVYNGYVSLVPNIIGYLTGFFEPWVARFLLPGMAYLSGALAFAVPALAMFLPGQISAAQRLILALMLAALPTSNFAMVQMTMFSMWYMALAVALLLVGGAVRNGKDAAILGTLGILTLLSNPVAMLFLPFCAWRAWRAETKLERGLFLTMVVLIPLYYLTAVDRSGIEISAEGGMGVLAVYWLFDNLLAQRVLLETLLGTDLVLGWRYDGYGNHMTYILPGYAALVLGVGLWLWRRQRDLFAVYVLCHAMALLLIVFTLYSRGAFLDHILGKRYTFIPALLIATSFALALMRALERAAPARAMACLGLTGLWLAMVNLSDLEIYRMHPVDRAVVSEAMAAYRADPGTCIQVERFRFPIVLGDASDPDTCQIFHPERAQAAMVETVGVQDAGVEAAGLASPRP